VARSDDVGFIVTSSREQKIFVKCPHCKHVVFTVDIIPLLNLLLSKEKYTCKECGGVLDFTTLSLCSRELGSWCDTCEFRFPCFSMRNAT